MKNKKAIIKTGPFGLVEVRTEKGSVYINCNGLFSLVGEKITTEKALAVLGLA